MKFNLSAIVLSTILYLGMIISSNIGDGFEDGPFKIAPITYGLIFSTLSTVILSKIQWFGLLTSWLGFALSSGIILYFQYKEHTNVSI
jgi:hypothetical protein